MLTVIKKNYYLLFLLTIYSLLVLTWAYIHLMYPADSFVYQIYSDIYGYTALLSGIYGLYTSRKWGSFQSYMGKAVSFLSLGLLFQGLGQMVYSFYYLVLNVEVPYPSYGDIGFFGSIFMYALGVWFLGRAAGVKFNIGSAKSMLLAITVPLLLLAFSYYTFLVGYDFSESTPLLVFLDFGYPLGQAFYISLGVLVYLLTKGVLGGSMRPKVLFIIFALFVQYVADFVFLYQFMNETWTAGGVNDLTYLLAYLFMTLALVNLETTFSPLKVSGD